MTDLDSIIRGYIDAVYFTEVDEDGLPNTPLAAISLRRIQRTCEGFYELYKDKLEEECGASLDQVGHDLHLTRQGHGVGFWDRSDDFYPLHLRNEFTDYARKLSHIDEFIFEEDIASRDFLKSSRN